MIEPTYEEFARAVEDARPFAPHPALGLAALFILLVLASLTACATQPKPQPVAAVSCLPLKAYTPAEQKALADRLRKESPDSPLAQAMVDYGKLRDADRACLASRQ